MKTRVVSSQQRRWTLYAAGCVSTAAAVAAAGLVISHHLPGDAIWLAILLVLGTAQTEISGRIERERRAISGLTHVNVTTVWLVAAAALMTPGWAALLAIGLHVHLWARVWRVSGNRRTDRMAASAAAATISTWAASAVLHYTPLGGLQDAAVATSPVVVVAAVAFEAVNVALVAAGVFLRTGKRSLPALLGTWRDNLLELVTLCLGAITAMLLACPWPLLALLVVPPLLIQHRAALTDQMEDIAVTDSKTAVYNVTGWRHRAQNELLRCARRDRQAVLLMIDVDRFKRVNDTHGHLAGDDVLRDIATTITSHVRAPDIVGRFGGEEFVVLLPNTTADNATAVAERIRTAAAQLQVPIVADERPGVVDELTVSIGLAACPDAGTDLDTLLGAADAAVYAAKRSGRNKLVHYARPAQL